MILTTKHCCSYRLVSAPSIVTYSCLTHLNTYSQLIQLLQITLYSSLLVVSIGVVLHHMIAIFSDGWEATYYPKWESRAACPSLVGITIWREKHISVASTDSFSEVPKIKIWSLNSDYLNSTWAEQPGRNMGAALSSGKLLLLFDALATWFSLWRSDWWSRQLHEHQLSVVFGWYLQ